jgi:hypothetical protein
VREVYTYGRLTDGILTIHRRSEFNQALKALTDGRVILTVSKLYNKRSTVQNAYYWGVIVNEFREGYKEMTGEDITSDQAHELLKQKCNGKEIAHPSTGEIITVGQTTTDLTTVEFMEYWARCRDFIMEWFGRYVGEPNEQLEIFKT